MPRFVNFDFAPWPFCGNIDTSDESFFEMPNQSDNGCVVPVTAFMIVFHSLALKPSFLHAKSIAFIV